MPKELTTVFSYTFSGQIWKTCPDPVSGLLAVEIRDNEKHEAFFSILDTGSGKIVLKDLSLPETWWISLDMLQRSVLFTRIFPDEQNPGESDVMAYDISGKEILWQIEGFVPVSYDEDSVTGYRASGESRQYGRIDIRSGKMTLPDPGDSAPETSGKKPVSMQELSYPVRYHEEEENFKTVAEFLESRHISPVKALDYLEYGNCIIIGYYARAGENLVNFLLILDKEGHMLFQETTGKDLRGIGRDPFLVIGSRLIFTKDEKTLSCIDLI